MKKRHFVIVTGTDPNSRHGGIGFVLPGYLRSLFLNQIDYISIPTYDPSNVKGKLLLWMFRLLGIIRQTVQKKKLYDHIFIYSHAGSGISLFRECIIISISKIFGAITILHNHAPQIDHYLTSKLKKSLFSLAVFNADRIIVLTDWWKKRLAPVVGPHKLRVIHNPLTLNLENVAGTNLKKEIMRKPEIRILAMARLAAGKGVDIAVNAMKYLPNDFKLTIAGDGPNRKAIEAIVKENKLADRVNLIGWISGNQKEYQLKNNDIFCLPSVNDAFPISFVEAMAYGLPVVGVKYGGIPDIVDNGKVGFLADKQDPELIAKELLKLRDPETRYRMGCNSKKWVLKICSAEAVGASIRNILSEFN